MLVSVLILSLLFLTAFLEKPLDSYAYDEGEAPSWIDNDKQQEQIVDRWYVDVNTAQCKPFKYKGSLGNFNNFVSQSVCENHLKFTPEEQVKACDEPMAKGLCKLPEKDQYDRWYYSKSAVEANGEKNSCHKFKYSGCGGNANNFNSLTDCKNACQNQVNSKVEGNGDEIKITSVPNEFDCLFSAEVDTHDPIMGIVLHKNKKQCVYAAVGKKANRGFFDDLPTCVEKCIPKPVPACNTDDPFQVTPNDIIESEDNKSTEEYFYFKNSEKVCLSFISQIPDDKKIIDGGENNIFSSVELCASFCPATKNIGEIKAIEACKQPTVGVFGNDDKYKLTRYSYKVTNGNGSCQEFQFNGKQLNSNNFKSLPACQEICENPLKPNVPSSVGDTDSVNLQQQVEKGNQEGAEGVVNEDTESGTNHPQIQSSPAEKNRVETKKVLGLCKLLDWTCWKEKLKPYMDSINAEKNNDK